MALCFQEYYKKKNKVNALHYKSTSISQEIEKSLRADKHRWEQIAYDKLSLKVIGNGKNTLAVTRLP